jgi:hypothetical protein
MTFLALLATVALIDTAATAAAATIRLSNRGLQIRPEPARLKGLNLMYAATPLVGGGEVDASGQGVSDPKPDARCRCFYRILSRLTRF